MKKFARKKRRNIFLKAFFSIRENLFSKFPHKIFVIFVWYHWLRKVYIFLYCALANHNPELLNVICTGVTLLHWFYTGTALLSANQNRVFFMYIIIPLIFLINGFL